ncbi:FHA domain containing protein [Trypanosoma brucei equiperdum]|uniref:FHA domain containing protein n=1 Tax=Trypanosoma brucei equiperdum TaxID=630700 RepID=A0A3L6L4D1_9TRYP|nr:FHA domain containing protein [Trypanosoma brucei equiperdum]
MMEGATQSSLSQIPVHDRVLLSGNMDSVDDDLETVIFSDGEDNLETCTVVTETDSDGDAGQHLRGATNGGAANRLHSQHTLGDYSDHTVQRTNNIPPTPAPAMAPVSASSLVTSIVPEPQLPVSFSSQAFPVILPVMQMTWELLAPVAAEEGVEREGEVGKQQSGGKFCVRYCLASKYGEPLRPTDINESALPERLTCACRMGRDDIPQPMKALRTNGRNQQTLLYKHTISREHCVVRFHFKLQCAPQGSAAAAPSGQKPFYKWTSFDVTDLSSSNGTYCRTVRLFPSHRYSFPLTRTNAAQCVELQLGTHYQCTIRVLGGNSIANCSRPVSSSDASSTAVAAVDASVQFSPSPEVVLTNFPPPKKVPRIYNGCSPFYVEEDEYDNDNNNNNNNIDGVSSSLATKPGYTQQEPKEKLGCATVEESPMPRPVGQSCEEVSNTAPSTLPKQTTVEAEGTSGNAHRTSTNQTDSRRGTVTPSVEVLSSKVKEPKCSLTVVTTGIHCKQGVMQSLLHMNIYMNPDISNYKKVTHLVIKGPLVRSIKLLTVLPYVHHLVNGEWFEGILSCIPKDPMKRPPNLVAVLEKFNPSDFTYSEEPSADSIEVLNDFSLKALMDTPPEKRQALFEGLVFYLHPAAKPQSDADNNLRRVIVASGGTVTRRAALASVAILPEANMCGTGVAWEGVAKCRKEPLCIFVTTEDLFRSVLQQRRLTATTVQRPPGCTALPPSPQSRQKRKRS